MNDDALTTEDERLLDRLIDGELNEGERRRLLLRLEHSADGWRRCALAFLEAQAWRGEVKSLVNEPAPPAAKPQASMRASHGWHASTHWLPAALAAGMLVAASWMFFESIGRGPQQVAPGAGSAVADFRPPAGGAGNDPSNLRLVVNEGPGGGRNVVEVPLVEPTRMNEALFGPGPQTLPADVVRMLEQNGHQVLRQRTLVPVDLRDGRRVVVPMDQVEIRPVGMQSFQ